LFFSLSRIEAAQKFATLQHVSLGIIRWKHHKLSLGLCRHAEPTAPYYSQFRELTHHWPEEGDYRCREALFSVLKEGNAGYEIPAGVQAHLQDSPVSLTPFSIKVLFFK